MKNSLILGLIFVSAMVSACTQTTGKPMEYAKACSEENEKQYIEVVGFLDDKGSLFCSNTGGGPVRCGFKLLETPGAEKGFSADIESGSGANTADKPERGYKKEDLKVRDKDGNVLDLTQKVKLVGKMNYAKSGSATSPDVCYLTVTNIEKAQ